ncbi:MAG: hypothetical protein E7167_01045 [Firmicutes bacterium]|nr:hypothetical protein [Bacillota bacterium]
MNNSFDESIDLVYQSLMATSLNAQTEKVLSQFMEAYHQTLQEHLNSEIELPQVTERLRILTGPIQEALNTPDDGNLHPAADFIKNKLNEQGKEMEKPFARVLKNPNAPSLHNSQEEMNGFSFAIIIVCFTIVLGMVLGALLFLIK